MAILEGPAATGRSEPDTARVRREIDTAGPSAADVLRALVHGTSGLLDAPARLAMLRAGRLEWVLAQDDDDLGAGMPVATRGTPCGDAWRDGEPRLLDDGDRPAPCLGTPPAALVVPVVLPPASRSGRRAAGGAEVCALLALTGPRAGWFDSADRDVCADLAAVAAQRLALLVGRAQPAVREAAPDEQPQPTRPVPRLLPIPQQGTARPDQTRPEKTSPAPAVPLPPALPAADSMGLWQWDAASGRCTWSTPVARLLGVPLQADLRLDMIREVVDPADRPRFDIAVRAVGSGRGVAGALRLNLKDGTKRHAYAWSEVRRADDGTLLGAWGGVVDVTAFERDAAAQRRALSGVRAAQELTGLATWEWRPDTGELVWSEEMHRLTGIEAQPSRQDWHSMVHPDDLERARRLEEDLDPDGAPRVEAFRLVGPEGAVRHLRSWACAGPVEGTGPARASGQLPGRRVLGATIDVTRQVEDRATAARLTDADRLTGLPDRAGFERLLAEELRRPGAPVTVIRLDLDRFRAVNVGLGHSAGDRLLVEVAGRLAGALDQDGPGSVLARTGGDEFAVLLPAGGSEVDALGTAERLLDLLREPCVLPETAEILPCAASLGVARSDARRDPQELLRQADLALHRAKETGRDRCVLFDTGLRQAAEARTRAERRVRGAIDAGRLSMRFEPVVDFVHGRIVGARGLVRMTDSPDDPSPGDDPFDDGSTTEGIPADLVAEVAERTGLVVQLDVWAVESAIGQIARWGEHTGEAGESPWLSVHVSARSLAHPAVTRRLLDAVRRGEVDRDRLRLEVGEHDVAGAVPGVEAALRQLTAAGLSIGIDGFGTGYAAISHLAQLQPAFVTIDPSFTAGAGESVRGDALVSAAVELAHAYGMGVVAAGVESGRQARRLRELGCDLAVGGHFGRPGEPTRIVRG